MKKYNILFTIIILLSIGLLAISHESFIEYRHVLIDENNPLITSNKVMWEIYDGYGVTRNCPQGISIEEWLSNVDYYPFIVKRHFKFPWQSSLYYDFSIDNNHIREIK